MHGWNFRVLSRATKAAARTNRLHRALAVCRPHWQKKHAAQIICRSHWLEKHPHWLPAPRTGDLPSALAGKIRRTGCLTRCGRHLPAVQVTGIAAQTAFITTQTICRPDGLPDDLSMANALTRVGE
jgi:hypothetical protein